VHVFEKFLINSNKNSSVTSYWLRYAPTKTLKMPYDALWYLDPPDVSRFIVSPHYSLVLAILNIFQLFTLHLLVSTGVPQKAKPAPDLTMYLRLSLLSSRFSIFVEWGNTHQVLHEDGQPVFLPKKAYDICRYSRKHFKIISVCKFACIPIHLTILESFSPIWDQMVSEDFIHQSPCYIPCHFAWTS